MPVQFIYDDQTLTALLSGEIDHHSAAFLRQILDESIAKFRPSKLILDFDAVSFMDSSAVGLVMGRYRCVDAYGGAIEVLNLTPKTLRMMRLSGLQSLAVLRGKVSGGKNE
ncbi:MAG: anti-sigma factor antagonist [Oscillospiraceae bacterium]|nr:anti-sigma factor antagonist [Oscillospiraceae bacterium]